MSIAQSGPSLLPYSIGVSVPQLVKVNLGLNADRDEAGKVSYTVDLIFIALQACGPFMALFLNRPSKVERTDGIKVDLSIFNSPAK